MHLRPPDFENILIELGFGAPTHLGQTGKGGKSKTNPDRLFSGFLTIIIGFQRPLDLYVKQDGDRQCH